MARDIAGAHHERHDGSGYPRGLGGDDIPLSARIVAVADAYDAITSRRVYKPPVPHAEAKERIAAASGTQFDPQVVGTFLNRADEFVTIAGRFSEGLAVAA
jgi:putative two-component system response regulator